MVTGHWVGWVEIRAGFQFEWPVSAFSHRGSTFLFFFFFFFSALARNSQMRRTRPIIGRLKRARAKFAGDKITVDVVHGEAADYFFRDERRILARKRRDESTSSIPFREREGVSICRCRRHVDQIKVGIRFPPARPTRL